jgi:hypothetical protein
MKAGNARKGEKKVISSLNPCLPAGRLESWNPGILESLLMQN